MVCRKRHLRICLELIEIVYDCGKEERRTIGHTLFDNTLSTIFYK